ncbi:kinesin-like protein KIF23 isoform X1 [Homarus americanus]|uniref:kinesin-like protein KIF23 isoform X1 n=1 Tax=Homarus americanus TaxID=6706 RepID=UPI001C46BE47|nr:kinesin-like protein KIF23 isoform X1 [Homarus americanus]
MLSIMKPDRTPIKRKPRPTPKPKTVERHVEKDPVEVFCRIRPVETPDQEECISVIDSSTVKLTPPVTSFAFRNGNAKEQLYKFQNVFGPDTTQKELFDHVAKPLVSEVLNGKNGLLFAYGVTGSGKTYSMEGVPQDGGIVRRTLDVIFNSIQDYQARRCTFKPDRMNGFDGQSESDAFSDRRRMDATPNRITRTNKPRRETSGSQDNSQRIPDTSRIENIDEDNVFSLFVSYIQIYNNYIYDLLEEVLEIGPSRGLQTKILREDAQHNMYVHGCVEMEVKSPEDALEILYKGQKRRKIAYTRLNCESSRSHSIFTIRVVQAPLDAQGEDVVTDKNAITVSQLSLVDLAGSERNIRTKAVGDRIKEAGNINNSLMNLRACIEALRENQMMGGLKKVPYRDSKLTHYFKNYFDGEGKVNMVVCVNPKADDYDETLTVMKFAQLASEVQIQRVIQPVRHDLGLPPGRRRANQLFKEVRRRLEAEGENTKNLEVDLTPIYTLAPDWPAVTYTPETLEEVFTKLKAYLQKRVNSREKLKIDLKDKFSAVHLAIMDMEKENIIMKKEIASLRSLYGDAMSKVRSLESMLLNAESANESLQRKFSDYNNLVDDYNGVRDELDMAKTQGHLDKQRMKAWHKTKLEQEKEKIKNGLNAKFTQKKSKIYHTQVRALQEILLDGTSNTPVSFPPSSSDSDLSQIRPTARSAIKASTSDPKLNSSQAVPTPDLYGPAVVNLRHRRSRSQGAEVWLDHRPTHEVPSGTVLQPALQRCRSVTRLRSGDLTDGHVTNYCLTSQHQDSEGELETKLYKGDVLPTAGGGSQVVFQDVEILKQRDPLAVPSRKRSSDGTPKVDALTVQDRCAASIEGHTTPRPFVLNKRSRF